MIREGFSFREGFSSNKRKILRDHGRCCDTGRTFRAYPACARGSADPPVAPPATPMGSAAAAVAHGAKRSPESRAEIRGTRTLPRSLSPLAAHPTPSPLTAHPTPSPSLAAPAHSGASPGRRGTAEVQDCTGASRGGCGTAEVQDCTGASPGGCGTAEAQDRTGVAQIRRALTPTRAEGCGAGGPDRCDVGGRTEAAAGDLALLLCNGVINVWQ
jgi:hypothetical protein